MARFLHYYPQYTLDDLKRGYPSGPDFLMLYAGMVDNENPEQTEPALMARRRLVEGANRRAMEKARRKLGWS